jgi:hypothetical protein
MTRNRAEYYREYYQKTKDAKKEQKAETGKAYREKNKESLKQRNKEYYLKNKETICARTGENKRHKYKADPVQDLAKQKLWKIANQEKYLLQNAKARAKKYKTILNITVEDIVVPTHCPYLGIKLEPFTEWSSPSLDKIKPELGYVKGNVQVISNLANTMKSSATLEQLVTFAENVLKLHKEDTL